jgi:Permuted papain-like amidase enzyme, YaeF/YiiX, C92 family
MRGLLAVALLTVACANAPRLESRLRDGDIIFHESRSSQSRAIQLATGSRYSHMGILFVQHGRWFVYEAVQPVKTTPLDDWIRRGKNGHFVVKRLRDTRALTPAVLARMRAAGEQYRGKSYDLYFEWSDDRIYCSELVWKIYQRGAGIEIGRMQKLREFDLSNPAVRAKMRERYGARVPFDEPVISPAAMFDSAKLIEVARR